MVTPNPLQTRLANAGVADEVINVVLTFDDRFSSKWRTATSFIDPGMRNIERQLQGIDNAYRAMVHDLGTLEAAQRGLVRSSEYTARSMSHIEASYTHFKARTSERIGMLRGHLQRMGAYEARQVNTLLDEVSGVLTTRTANVESLRNVIAPGTSLRTKAKSHETQYLPRDLARLDAEEARRILGIESVERGKIPTARKGVPDPQYFQYVERETGKPRPGTSAYHMAEARELERRRWELIDRRMAMGHAGQARRDYAVANTPAFPRKQHTYPHTELVRTRDTTPLSRQIEMPDWMATARQRNIDTAQVPVAALNPQQRAGFGKLPRRYVVIDTETTGLEAGVDEIFQLSAQLYEDGKPVRPQVQYRGGKPVKYQQPGPITSINKFLKTQRPVDPKFNRSGLVTPEFLDRVGITFEELRPMLDELIGQNAVVMQNAQFDANRMLQRSHGYKIQTPIYDTVQMGRELFPGESVRLDDLRLPGRRMGTNIPGYEDRWGPPREIFAGIDRSRRRAHEAWSDVLDTGDWVEFLRGEQERRGITRVEPFYVPRAMAPQPPIDPEAELIASRSKVDISQVVGTGPGGRVTADDVKRVETRAGHQMGPGERSETIERKRVIREEAQQLEQELSTYRRAETTAESVSRSKKFYQFTSQGHGDFKEYYAGLKSRDSLIAVRDEVDAELNKQFTRVGRAEALRSRREVIEERLKPLNKWINERRGRMRASAVEQVAGVFEGSTQFAQTTAPDELEGFERVTSRILSTFDYDKWIDDQRARFLQQNPTMRGDPALDTLVTLGADQRLRKSQERGTMIHAEIEKALGGDTSRLGDQSFARQMVDYVKENRLEVLGLEQRLYDPSEKLTGAPDMIAADPEGRVHIFDFKTGGRGGTPYPENIEQLQQYAGMLRRMGVEAEIQTHIANFDDLNRRMNVHDTGAVLAKFDEREVFPEGSRTMQLGGKEAAEKHLSHLKAELDTLSRLAPDRSIADSASREQELMERIKRSVEQWGKSPGLSRMRLKYGERSLLPTEAPSESYLTDAFRRAALGLDMPPGESPVPYLSVLQTPEEAAAERVRARRSPSDGGGRGVSSAAGTPKAFYRDSYHTLLARGTSSEVPILDSEWPIYATWDEYWDRRQDWQDVVDMADIGAAMGFEHDVTTRPSRIAADPGVIPDEVPMPEHFVTGGLPQHYGPVGAEEASEGLKRWRDQAYLVYDYFRKKFDEDVAFAKASKDFRHARDASEVIGAMPEDEDALRAMLDDAYTSQDVASERRYGPARLIASHYAMAKGLGLGDVSDSHTRLDELADLFLAERRSQRDLLDWGGGTLSGRFKGADDISDFGSGGELTPIGAALTERDRDAWLKYVAENYQGKVPRPQGVSINQEDLVLLSIARDADTDVRAAYEQRMSDFGLAVDSPVQYMKGIDDFMYGTISFDELASAVLTRKRLEGEILQTGESAKLLEDEVKLVSQGKPTLSERIREQALKSEADYYKQVAKTNEARERARRELGIHDRTEPLWANIEAREGLAPYVHAEYEKYDAAVRGVDTATTPLGRQQARVHLQEQEQRLAEALSAMLPQNLFNMNQMALAYERSTGHTELLSVQERLEKAHEDFRRAAVRESSTWYGRLGSAILTDYGEDVDTKRGPHLERTLSEGALIESILARRDKALGALDKRLSSPEIRKQMDIFSESSAKLLQQQADLEGSTGQIRAEREREIAATMTDRDSAWEALQLSSLGGVKIGEVAGGHGQMNEVFENILSATRNYQEASLRHEKLTLELENLGGKLKSFAKTSEALNEELELRRAATAHAQTTSYTTDSEGKRHIIADQAARVADARSRERIAFGRAIEHAASAEEMSFRERELTQKLIWSGMDMEMRQSALSQALMQPDILEQFLKENADKMTSEEVQLVESLKGQVQGGAAKYKTKVGQLYDLRGRLGAINEWDIPLFTEHFASMFQTEGLAEATKPAHLRTRKVDLEEMIRGAELRDAEIAELEAKGRSKADVATELANIQYVEGVAAADRQEAVRARAAHTELVERQTAVGDEIAKKTQQIEDLEADIRGKERELAAARRRSPRGTSEASLSARRMRAARAEIDAKQQEITELRADLQPLYQEDKRLVKAVDDQDKQASAIEQRALTNRQEAARLRSQLPSYFDAEENQERLTKVQTRRDEIRQKQEQERQKKLSEGHKRAEADRRLQDKKAARDNIAEAARRRADALARARSTQGGAVAAYGSTQGVAAEEAAIRNLWAQAAQASQAMQQQRDLGEEAQEAYIKAADKEERYRRAGAALDATEARLQAEKREAERIGTRTPDDQTKLESLRRQKASLAAQGFTVDNARAVLGQIEAEIAEAESTIAKTHKPGTKLKRHPDETALERRARQSRADFLAKEQEHNDLLERRKNLQSDLSKAETAESLGRGAYGSDAEWNDVVQRRIDLEAEYVDTKEAVMRTEKEVADYRREDESLQKRAAEDRKLRAEREMLRAEGHRRNMSLDGRMATRLTQTVSGLIGLTVLLAGVTMALQAGIQLLVDKVLEWYKTNKLARQAVRQVTAALVVQNYETEHAVELTSALNTQMDKKSKLALGQLSRESQARYAAAGLDRKQRGFEFVAAAEALLGGELDDEAKDELLRFSQVWAGKGFRQDHMQFLQPGGLLERLFTQEELSALQNQGISRPRWQETIDDAVRRATTEGAPLVRPGAVKTLANRQAKMGADPIRARYPEYDSLENGFKYKFWERDFYRPTKARAEFRLRDSWTSWAHDLAKDAQEVATGNDKPSRLNEGQNKERLGELLNVKDSTEAMGLLSKEQQEQLLDRLRYHREVRDVVVDAGLMMSTETLDPALFSHIKGFKRLGGPVGASGAYVVGEEGPELVTLDAGSFVHPAAQTQAMLSNGASAGSTARHETEWRDLDRIARTGYNNLHIQQMGYLADTDKQWRLYWDRLTRETNEGWYAQTSAVDDNGPMLIDKMATLFEKLFGALQEKEALTLNVAFNAETITLPDALTGPVMLNVVPEFSTENEPGWFSAGSRAVNAAISFIEQNFPGWWAAGSKAIGAAVGFIGENFPGWWSAGSKAIKAVAGFIKENFPGWWEAGSKAISAAVSFIQENVPKWLEAGAKWIGAAVNFVFENVPKWLETGGKWIGAAIDFVFDNLPDWLNPVGEFLGSSVEFLFNNIPEWLNPAATLVGAAIGFVFRDVPDWLSNAAGWIERKLKLVLSEDEDGEPPQWVKTLGDVGLGIGKQIPILGEGLKMLFPDDKMSLDLNVVYPEPPEWLSNPQAHFGPTWNAFVGQMGDPKTHRGAGPLEAGQRSGLVGAFQDAAEAVNLIWTDLADRVWGDQSPLRTHLEESIPTFLNSEEWTATESSLSTPFENFAGLFDTEGWTSLEAKITTPIVNAVGTIEGQMATLTNSMTAWLDDINAVQVNVPGWTFSASVPAFSVDLPSGPAHYPGWSRTFEAWDAEVVNPFEATRMVTPNAAMGGLIKTGGVTLVGERGPELVDFPGGARISPLPTTPTAPAHREQPTHIEIPVYVGDRQVKRMVLEVLNGTVRERAPKLV